MIKNVQHRHHIVLLLRLSYTCLSQVPAVVYVPVLCNKFLVVLSWWESSSPTEFFCDRHVGDTTSGFCNGGELIVLPF